MILKHTSWFVFVSVAFSALETQGMRGFVEREVPPSDDESSVGSPSTPGADHVQAPFPSAGGFLEGPETPSFSRSPRLIASAPASASSSASSSPSSSRGSTVDEAMSVLVLSDDEELDAPDAKPGVSNADMRKLYARLHTEIQRMASQTLARLNQLLNEQKRAFENARNKEDQTIQWVVHSDVGDDVCNTVVAGLHAKIAELNRQEGCVSRLLRGTALEGDLDVVSPAVADLYRLVRGPNGSSAAEIQQRADQHAQLLLKKRIFLAGVEEEMRQRGLLAKRPSLADIRGGRS